MSNYFVRAFSLDESIVFSAPPGIPGGWNVAYLVNGVLNNMASPTIVEIDSAAPGLYSLAIDEATVTTMNNYDRYQDVILFITGTGWTGGLIHLTLYNALVLDPKLLVSTFIDTLDSQTVFYLPQTEASSIDGIYDGQLIVITDLSDPLSRAYATINTYVGSSRQVTLSADPAIFTMAAADGIQIIDIQDTTVGDVTLQDGAITAAKFGSSAITSTVLATDCITSTKFAANAIDSSAIAASGATKIAQSTWSEVLGSTGLSASAILQIVAGTLAGELSGASTTSITIRNIEDTATLITATVDADGNRSTVNISTPST